MKRVSESDDTYVANSAEELLEALELKATYILITKYYKDEFLENTEIPLGKENFFYPSYGAGINPLFLIMNLFDKEGTQQRKIENKVQKYYVKKYGEDLLLYLRVLDY